MAELHYTASKTPAQNAPAINREELKSMIAEAAYYIAEHRGFEGNYQLDDWLEAETKIEHIYGTPE